MPDRSFSLPQLSEHQIRNQILDLLNYAGYKAWTNNVGGFTQQYTNKAGITRKHHVRFSQPGMSDIFAIQPGTGRFVAIEVKTPKTKTAVTRWQEDFINQVKAKGGIAFVAWNLEMVERELNL